MSDQTGETVDLSSLLNMPPEIKEKNKRMPKPEYPPLDIRVVAIAGIFASVIAVVSVVLLNTVRSAEPIVVTVPVVVTATSPQIEPTPRIRNWEGAYAIGQTYGDISAGIYVKIKSTWYDHTAGIRWYGIETDWGMSANVPEDAFFARMAATPTAQFDDWQQTYVLITDAGGLAAGTVVNLGSTWYDEANAVRWYQVYTSDNRSAEVRQDQLAPSAYPSMGATPTAIYATWIGPLKLAEQVGNMPAGTMVTVGGATWYDGTHRWYTASTSEGVTVDVMEYQLVVP